MVITWKRKAAAFIGGALLLVVMPGAASAVTSSGPNQIGTMRNVIIGVPKSIHRGTTLHLHSWYIEKSRDRLLIWDFSVGIWGPSLPGRNITVQWLDPIAHRWRNASHAAPNNYTFEFPQSEKLVIPPNRWERTDFRITFAKTVRPGTWHVDAQVPGSYSLINYRGVSEPAVLGYYYPQYKFQLHR